MTTMTCPKCGFEQPRDQFCAKCGINISTYKPQVSIGTGLSSALKPIIFVALIIIAIYFLFRSVDNKIEAPPIAEDLNETTKIGSGAASLRVEKNVQTVADAAIPEKEVNIKPLAAQNRVAPADTAEEPTQKFNQIETRFMVGEINSPEPGERAATPWRLVPQANPMIASAPEEVLFKVGNNTFEYNDELISYDTNLFIEEITETDIKVRVNIRRILRAPTEPGMNNQTISLHEKIPLSQTLIIIDALPRRTAVDRPNSILSTLYKSPSFLSHASEFALIIKFENPSNSPQE